MILSYVILVSRMIEHHREDDEMMMTTTMMIMMSFNELLNDDSINRRPLDVQFFHLKTSSTPTDHP